MIDKIKIDMIEYLKKTKEGDKMKPKNKIKIISIMIAIAIIVVTLIILFFFTDIFRTNKGAFFRYIKGTAKTLEILNENEYETYTNLKKTMPYIEKGEMIITSSNNVADSSIMDKIKLEVTGTNDYKNGKSNYELRNKKPKS